MSENKYKRKNDGKVNMKYWAMFPNAAKAICERLTENEDKYPNDAFCDYVPEETIASLLRHTIDLSAPYPVFNLDETKLDHMKAIAFNSLCLLESCLKQEHEWSKEL